MADQLVTLGVVSNRPWTHDWLWWNIRKQSYRPLEIVVVTQDPDRRVAVAPGPGLLSACTAEGITFQFHTAPSTSTCGQLRNVVLEHATGSSLCWFDDDDWQHPDKVRWMVDALAATAEPWVGWIGGWLWHLHRDSAVRIGWEYPRVSNGAALYRTDAVRGIAYDDGRRGSDGRWIVKLGGYYKTRGELLRADDHVHSLWTRHAFNTAPGWFGTRTTKAAIVKKIGPVAWADSRERFVELAAGFTRAWSPA